MKLSIGERIRDCRKNINLTQEQLAEKLCVSFQTVSRWENGNSYPDIEVLPQLAQLFDVTMDYLFGNEGKQREDRANREFDKAMEFLDSENPDKKRAYEIIHSLRLDFPDHNRLVHLFVFVFSSDFSRPPPNPRLADYCLSKKGLLCSVVTMPTHGIVTRDVCISNLPGSPGWQIRDIGYD